MNIHEEVARARSLSDDALLGSLTGVVRTSKRLTALIVAHLGELEERRLHLLAGYASMFEYCTVKLEMSEDEACRRIEVARLARRFPVLYERLASGAVSLSVAALLKPHLSEANHDGLLDAVSGKTVARAREVLAAWFPRPDVPPSIRKLPERRPAGAAQRPESNPPFEPSYAGMGKIRPDAVACGAVESDYAGCSNVPGNTGCSNSQRGNIHPGKAGCGDAQPESVESDATECVDAGHAATSSPSTPVAQTASTEAKPTADRPTSNPSLVAGLRPPSRGVRPSHVAPLSPGRFKVTFTADAELKQKLDLARDLLRHAVPSGDLPTNHQPRARPAHRKNREAPLCEDETAQNQKPSHGSNLDAGDAPGEKPASLARAGNSATSGNLSCSGNIGRPRNTRRFGNIRRSDNLQLPCDACARSAHP